MEKSQKPSSLTDPPRLLNLATKLEWSASPGSEDNLRKHQLMQHNSDGESR